MTKWMHFFQVSAARLDTTLKIFSWPVHTSQWLKMFTTKFGFFLIQVLAHQIARALSS